MARAHGWGRFGWRPLSSNHEFLSAVGTFRTWRDVRSESAFRGKAEVQLTGRQFSL